MVDAAANTGTDFLQAINSLQGKPITTADRNQALKGIAKEYTDLSKGEQEVAKEAIIQKPPEPGKPPAPPTPDPMKSFGSVAMMFATLGSLMTRRPLTNALNAGAKVMQAQNNQDWAAYKTAYDQWKFNADELMKLADWKNQQIKNIMDTYKGQEDMMKAQLGVLAAASGDPDLDRMKDLMTVQEIRDRSAVLTATYKQKMDDVIAIHDLADAQNEQWAKANNVPVDRVPKGIKAQHYIDASASVGMAKKGNLAGGVLGPINFSTLKPTDIVPGANVPLNVIDQKVEGLHEGLSYADIGISMRTQNNPQRDVIDQRWAEKYPNDDRATIKADYAAKKKADVAFATGKQGDIVKSQNVAVDHMAVLRDLISGLSNGDVQLINKAANNWAEQTGSAAPTNFDGVKIIVGDEIAKAVIGGINAQADRENLQLQLSRVKSPEQLNGVLDSFVRLMVGQIDGNRRQYETSTGKKDFDKFLSPATLEAYKEFKPSSSKKAVGKPIDKKYVQELIDHRDDPEAIKSFNKYFGDGAAEAILQDVPEGQ